MGDPWRNHSYDPLASQQLAGRPQGKLPRSITIGVWVSLGLVVVWVAGSLRFFVFPPQITSAEQVDDVDAVYVLGIATEERLTAGVDLVESGASDHLVVTVTPGNPLHRFCTDDHEFTVHCVTPEPVTTRGEARQWAQLAKDQQFDSVAIVTMRPHATRTLLYFERCFRGETHVVDDEVFAIAGLHWVEPVVYETGAMLKFVFSKDC